MAAGGRLMVRHGAAALLAAAGPALAACPAGTLPIGSADAGVCLARLEVTVRQYQRCVEAGACRPRAAGAGCNSGTRRADHPANCVVWTQADAYCRWQGGRLPTSDEWARAARTALPPAPARPGDDPPADVCWGRGTCEVGSFCAGGSLCDMAGNVAEWTATAWQRPDGRTDRIVKGGGWRFDAASFAATLDPAYQQPLAPETTRADLGLRCAVGVAR
jgi:formylglycine-generating enzyme required for sulfatase activity